MENQIKMPILYPTNHVSQLLCIFSYVYLNLSRMEAISNLLKVPIISIFVKK